MNEFFCLHDNSIYFGLTDIKGVGKSVFEKLKDITKDIDLKNIKWLDLLINILLKINSTAAKALISSGAISFIDKSRNSMLFELSIIDKLTDREISIVKPYLSTESNLNLKQFLEILLSNKITKKRQDAIQELLYSLVHPPFSLTDTPEWISDNEDMLLGYSITCSKIDMYDISMTNATCRDIKNNVVGENILLAGEIDNINIVKTKSGNSKGMDMAFVSVSDSTGNLDSVICFAEQYKQFKNVLFSGNIIIVKGKKSKTRDGLIVEKIFLPSA